MVWDAASNLPQFVGLEGALVHQLPPQGLRQGYTCSIKKALLQLGWAHWQLRQGGWFLAKNLPPKGRWWIEQD
jgi:hypothetical protein